MSGIKRNQVGFTLLESVIVVAALGIVAAFSVPSIVNAMRAHRVNIGLRTVADTISRAKMTAVSENRRTGIALDPENRQIGVIFYNDDNSFDRVEYRPLPDGVSFDRPNTTSRPAGVTGDDEVSFPLDSEYGVYTLNFSARGMPINAFGTTESIFVGNGRDYRALTISTVGGLRAYHLDETTSTWTWINSSSRSH
jgi:prepilin-type N-terminal cleavage/methylation domain-containing protein